MYFKKLKILKWQQIEDIELDFHDKLTIITGANASGKTTILNLLARHFDWQSTSIATPFRDKTEKVWRWLAGFFLEDGDEKNIGFLEYDNGAKANLSLPKQIESQYNVEILGQQPVDCFYIPSHGPIFRYEKLNQIPTQTKIDKKQAFQKVSNSNKVRYFGGSDKPSSFYMKETLISWNIFGQGNVDMEGDERLLTYFKEFEKILKILLPKEIGFKKLSISNFEVVLKCETNDFLIDAASGGLSAVIDIAWQIFMYSAEKDQNFTVLIDEVENHLHPTMQRRVLPDLLEAFPSVRFIISTHNPLIVGSVKDSKVYVLKFNKNEGGKSLVSSQELDLVNKAKTASEILDEVLGVSFTMPIWVEEKLQTIVDNYSAKEMTKEEFTKMRDELREIGLEKLMPEAVYKVVEKKDDQS